MNKTILACVTAIFALVVFILVNHAMDQAGWSIIKSKIDRQYVNIVSNTPALGEYPITGRHGGKIIGNNPPYTGKLWYGTTVNGEDGLIVVYWVGDSNQCQITKIEVQSTSLSPKTLWQRSEN
jgi:hypothetical protein